MLSTGQRVATPDTAVNMKGCTYGKCRAHEYLRVHPTEYKYIKRKRPCIHIVNTSDRGHAAADTFVCEGDGAAAD